MMYLLAPNTILIRAVIKLTMNAGTRIKQTQQLMSIKGAKLPGNLAILGDRS